MPDNNTTPATATPVTLEPLPIERNGVSVVLVEDKKRVKEGQPAEYFYMPSPKFFDKGNWDNLVKFFGVETIIDYLTAKVRQMAQTVMEDATDPAGALDLDKVAKFWSELSSRTETKAELLALFDDKFAEMNKAAADATAAINSGTATIEMLGRVMQLQAEAQALKEAADRKSRKRKEGEPAAEAAA
jgi:hypothetical protein